MREAPQLRIVSDELWRAVRARDRPLDGAKRQGAPMRTLFAGILRCPGCGGPMTAIDARRYGCNVHNDRGTSACANGAGYPRQAVDGALLRVVRDELLSPAAMADLQAALKAALGAAARQDDAKARRARMQAVEAEIGRLVDAVSQLGAIGALGARLRTAEAERAQLELQLRDRGAASPVLTAEQAMAAYRRRMLDLKAALESDADRERTRSLLASMLGPVRLTRDATGDWAEMEEPVTRVAMTGSTPLEMVAGARNVLWKRVRVR